MRQLFLGIIAALVLIGSLPVAAGQHNAAVQEKPASSFSGKKSVQPYCFSTPQAVTCEVLWPVWRVVVKRYLRRLQSPAAFVVATQGWPTPQPGQHLPANWNVMDAQQQASWLCRDDPERVTARCKMVPKDTAAQTVPPATPLSSDEFVVPSSQATSEYLAEALQSSQAKMGALLKWTGRLVDDHDASPRVAARDSDR